MNNKHINILSVVYIVAPIIIFFAGWLKPLISVPVLLICVLSLALFISREWQKKECIAFSLKELFPTVVLICLWVYFSGIGGLVYQNTDHEYRNAIFNILVDFDWPVINGGKGLIYYIGFWLPSALVGKIFGLTAGYLFQVVWAILGIFLCCCLMFEYFGKVSTKAVVVFIVFSGLDVVGAFLNGWSMQNLDYQSIEWWSGFQYSCFTTQLFWVFNQAIYGWIITLTIMKQEDNRHIVFLWSCGLLSCTFPFVGMLPFVVFKIIRNIRDNAASDLETLHVEKKKSKFADFIRATNLFTFSNVLGGGCIGIITFMYETANASAMGANATTESVGSIKGRIAMYVLFVILDVGVYWLTMYKYQCKNPLYWLCGGVLLVCPWIEVGDGCDFCMRASIPALLLLMLLVMDTFKQAKRAKDYCIVFAILVIILIGSVTPLEELKRVAHQTYNYYQAGIALEQEAVPYDKVFKTSNFSGSIDNSFFFKYLAKVE